MTGISGLGAARPEIFEHILGFKVGASYNPSVSAQKRENKQNTAGLE
jgi:hypothetical protein